MRLPEATPRLPADRLRSPACAAAEANIIAVIRMSLRIVVLPLITVRLQRGPTMDFVRCVTCATVDDPKLDGSIASANAIHWRSLTRSARPLGRRKSRSTGRRRRQRGRRSTETSQMAKRKWIATGSAAAAMHKLPNSLGRMVLGSAHSTNGVVTEIFKLMVCVHPYEELTRAPLAACTHPSVQMIA